MGWWARLSVDVDHRGYPLGWSWQSFEGERMFEMGTVAVDTSESALAAFEQVFEHVAERYGLQLQLF